MKPALALALFLAACARSPEAAPGLEPAAERAAPREPVLAGIDVLLETRAAVLAGRRVGLLTHAAGVLRDGRRTVDALQDCGVEIAVLFAPEHGLASAGEGQLDDARDARTGLRIASLYGSSRAPSAADLARIDVLVVDLQDVGARFYTYAATLGLALEACASSGTEVLVLDRPNPLGGLVVAGPLRDQDQASFTAWHTLTVRHGMTIAELARLYVAERPLPVELSVVACRGWRRDMLWEDTGLSWVPPSPNLPTPTSALLYPGVALWEFTNLSVGRGSALPFQQIGAPWLDARAAAAALERDPPAGVRIAATEFTPLAGPYAGELCRGLRFELAEPRACDPLDLGLALAAALRSVHAAEWDVAALDRLLADRETAALVLAGADRRAIQAAWAPEIAHFRARRARHLLYPES